VSEQPTSLPGVDPLIVYRLGEPLTVFRGVKVDDRESPLLLDSLRSNYELGRRPRHVEITTTPIHMGISVYLTNEQAAATVRAFPAIGAYVAELRLVPETGAAFADTGPPGHLTLWGRPLDLLAVIADIVPV
jgi:hypothetical protein